jgi:hypothetical protein
MNTTVIVQRFLNILLVFLNVRGWTKGGLRPPGKPLLYPLEKTQITLLVQLVVIVFKHYVKGLGFPKYERFRGILYFVKQIILFISYIAKVAIL